MILFPMHVVMMKFFVMFMKSVTQRKMAFATCNNIKNDIYQKCKQSEKK